MLALDIFVVLYQRDPEAAETLITLSQIDFASLGIDVEVHIWDNARAVPVPPNAHFLPFRWRYFASPENEPLSKVYNMLVRESRRPHVVIFDQDSSVDAAFLEKLADCLEKVEIEADVFVPVIRHDGHLISPGRLRWIKGEALCSVTTNAMLPTDFTAMMSGLCISRAFLTRLAPHPFDERLRLYGVDTRFCRDLAKHGARAYLHEAVLGHDSALRSTTDPLAALQRQIWLWQSWLRVFDRNPFEMLAIRCYVMWKALRISVGPRAPGNFFDVIAEVFR
ncbi:GT2 family glycosyltransferase [Paraburkholderia sp. BL6665CI2N2]|uniref:glycosyltransferase n=1 Tax=Paraburkholderia sp. BL6665CI2N2 TaxID=1938806 RepID=UPI001065B709|nr:glycosyltransferase [Paraburkholderia sp. BL6665CI2N2]TDY17034.1 GT2 family glycosyltransferase [Paraburkholderia sp. BL6665CI2N2]